MSDTQTGSQNASGEPNDAQGTNDTTNNAQTPDDAASGANDTSSSTSTGDDAVSREEFSRLEERMKAADRAKAKAENELKELKRKEMGDLEKAQDELKEVTAQRDGLQKQLDQVRLENAFLSNNKYSWVDPSDALRLMDLSDVTTEDGKVVGLDKAIDTLAKNKPHLLKRDDEDGKGSSAASGSANNGTRKGDKKQPPKNYSSRFPALRR